MEKPAFEKITKEVGEEQKEMIFRCFLFLAIGLLAVQPAKSEQVEADLLIVGATESGWAAAIQAARLGVKKIVIVHDGNWYGGQFTEQALACVDENKGVGKIGWGVSWHPMKRSFHRFGLFKELMDRIEDFNGKKYGSPMPGRPYHGPSTFRPAEAEMIFQDMIKPYVESGQVREYWQRYPIAATVNRSAENPRLESVSFATIGNTSTDLTVNATITIDASDWGEVIQVSGAESECGPDPPERYGEPSAPKSFPPNEMNPITWPMIIVESSSETPIEKPDRFDDRFFPRATHLSRQKFGKLKWERNVPIGAITHWPDFGKASPRQLSVYTVRRIVDGNTSNDDKTAILLNYMNGQDYPLERLPDHVVAALEKTEAGASTKNIVQMTRNQREIVFADAKRHSLCVLYHLQNFVHDAAADKANSFRRFRLSDEFGTTDRLPPKPYIRESLRLKAMYMMREQDGRNRDAKTKTGAKPRFAAVMYPDGLFSWQFHYDFHRTGRVYLADEGDSGPWIDYHKPNRHTSFLSDRSVFPLRSLIPATFDGLIGSQGNVGFSSIVSAAIRLHDQRIHIGQAAGATAAIALRRKSQPRQLVFDREALESIRHALCGEVEGGSPILLWPFRDLPSDHPNFVAINRLAAARFLPIETYDVDFQPDAIASPEWIAEVKRLGKVTDEIKLNDESLTRGEVCQKVWKSLATRNWKPWKRVSESDADGDRIRDSEDTLIFTPNLPVEFKIERTPLGPREDGIPDSEHSKSAIRFDFGPPNIKPQTQFRADNGRLFEQSRGYGWEKDLSNNHRSRRTLDGARDSFVFTRGRDTWNFATKNGRYRVTVCLGDSNFPQPGQSLTLESTKVIENESTESGQFIERSAEVSVADKSLTIEIGSGKPGMNTCLNWVIVEPK